MDEHALLSALQASESLWDMPSFLSKYTLHDSALNQVRITPYLGVIVLIDWDLHWNATVPKSYDTLAIQFKMPYRVNWNQGSWHYSTLEGASSRVVTESERERLLDESSIDLSGFGDGEDELQPYALSKIQPLMFDESLTRTIFEGMNSSSSEVIHSRQVSFACFNSAGDAWIIPTRNSP